MDSLTVRNGFLGRKLELLPDNIKYEGHHYPYEDIVHLGRYAQRFSINFLPMGDYVRIKIYLNSKSKPITIANSFGLIGTTGTIKKAYEILVEKTFQNRIGSYLKDVKDKGYFVYGKAKFYQSGNIVIGKKEFNIKETKLWLEPFKLVLKPNTGILTKKKRISTDLDQDVFLTLLKEIYGITFS